MEQSGLKPLSPCMPCRSPIKLKLSFAAVFVDYLAELPLFTMPERILTFYL
tara:strand:+ start:44 stop:196 length:153 start_codon:yes stop_codon:yes gene_type:complete